MSVQAGYVPLVIGSVAPDFEAETTEGRIRFHDWMGDGWAILFSHPKDFTPVCTTELGYMARLKPEFDKRNVKIIGLSVDPVGNHAKWADDIKETQGNAVNYPMIGDPYLSIAKAWRMLPVGQCIIRKRGGGPMPWAPASRLRRRISKPTAPPRDARNERRLNR